MVRKRKVSLKSCKKEFSSVGLTMFLYVLLVLVLPMVFQMYYTIKHPSAMIDPNTKNIMGYLTYIIIIVGTLIPFTLLLKISRVKVTEFCRKSNVSWFDFLVSFICYIAFGTALFFVISTINNYFHLGTITINPIGLTSDSFYTNSIIMIILYIFALPFVEEFAFRGVLLRVLGRYGNHFALITVSLFYALMHTTVSEAIISFALSYFLIKMTLKYRSIQPVILMQIGLNGLLFVINHLITYQFIVTVIIAVIYVLSIFFLIIRRFKMVKLKRSSNHLIARIFYTRLSVIITIVFLIMLLAYSTYFSI